MSKKPLDLIEAHVEKAVVGLAGLILVAMIVMYLVRSPNTIPYGPNEIGAGDLADAIKRDADGLRAALDKAKPQPVEVPDYSAQLERQQQLGLLASADAPGAPPRLRLAADFSRPLPALSDEDQGPTNLAIVTPLPPVHPVVQAGVSLAIRKRPVIAPPTTGGPAPTSQPEFDEKDATQVTWADVACYFPRKEQQEAMTRAGYPAYLARPYVVGTEVQRQEVQADGQFSEWQTVDRSLAMPELNIPEPEFDDAGGITNDAQIREKYELVRAAEAELMQPPFYHVLGGDEWDTPPLPGYEPEEPQEIKKPPPKNPDEGRKPPKPGPGPTPPAPPSGGGGRSTGGGSGAVTLGGAGTAQAPSPGASEAARKRKEQQEARKAIDKDLTEIKAALKAKDRTKAEQIARQIVENKAVSGSQKKKAEFYLKRLARGKKPSDTPVGGAPGAGGLTIAGVGGGRGTSGGPAPVAQAEKSELVTNPQDAEQVAVWFHDDSVEPGKTYRYRMRVNLWNRYVGKARALKNPQSAKQTVLAGDWSAPSPSVTVPPSTCFFLLAGSPDKERASVEIFKWYKGEWIGERFNVAVGDVVGGKKKVSVFDEDFNEVKEELDFSTGAVVLDLRYKEPILARAPGGKASQFVLRQTESVVMVYVNPADGQVKERIQALDRNDPMYLKLKDMQ